MAPLACDSPQVSYTAAPYDCLPERGILALPPGFDGTVTVLSRGPPNLNKC